MRDMEDYMVSLVTTYVEKDKILLILTVFKPSSTLKNLLMETGILPLEATLPKIISPATVCAISLF